MVSTQLANGAVVSEQRLNYTDLVRKLGEVGQGEGMWLPSLLCLITGPGSGRRLLAPQSGWVNPQTAVTQLWTADSTELRLRWSYVRTAKLWGPSHAQNNIHDCCSKALWTGLVQAAGS